MDKDLRMQISITSLCLMLYTSLVCGIAYAILDGTNDPSTGLIWCTLTVAAALVLIPIAFAIMVLVDELDSSKYKRN